MFIDARTIERDSVVEANLAIVGSGEETGELKKRARATCCPAANLRIFIHGKLNQILVDPEARRVEDWMLAPTEVRLSALIALLQES